MCTVLSSHLKRGKLIKSNREFKLLDIGWGLNKTEDVESVEVDEDNFASASSFYDYDAVFLDPAELSSLWTDHLRPQGDGSFRSNPREDGGLTRGLQNLMRARQEEVEELLNKNSSVFCKLRKPGKELTVVKNGENESIGSYSWLPTTEGLIDPVSKGIKKRKGKRLKITKKNSPLGAFLDSYREVISYRAVFNRDIKMSDVRVESIAVTPSDELAGFALNVNGGNIYFLPAEMNLDQSGEQELLEAAGDLFGFQLYEGPRWLDEYKLEEEKSLRSEYEETKENIAELRQKKEEKLEDLKAVSSYKRLLSAGSEFELKAVLGRVLDDLGFGTDQANSGIDILVSSPEDDSFAVKVGVNHDGPLGLEPYHELVRGINDLKIYENDDPQGVLVVNGYSGSDPAERPEQIKDELLSGCNLYGFTVITSTELFEVLKGKRSLKEKAAAVEKLFEQG